MSQLTDRTGDKVRESIWARAAAAIFWSLISGGHHYITRRWRKP